MNKPVLALINIALNLIVAGYGHRAIDLINMSPPVRDSWCMPAHLWDALTTLREWGKE